MMQRYSIGILLIALGGCAVGRDAASGEWARRAGADVPRRYECRRAMGPVNIDGRIEEAAWAAAPWTADFVDIRGAAGPRPPLRTRLKMVWDDAALYVAAELEEPHVWGALTQHDAIVFQDNDFEVFIDPDGARRNYYEIEVNPLNTIFDLFLVRTYIDGGPALHGWDCKGLRSAVHVDGTLNNPADTDRGWSVEMAIPWAALKEGVKCPAPPRAGDTWRMDFSRVEWRVKVVNGGYEKLPNTPEDNWVWSPPGLVNMHLPERWGYVTFR